MAQSISVGRFAEHLKCCLKCWTASEVVKVKNDKMFNFKNCIPEDQTMKIKNTETYNTLIYMLFLNTTTNHSAN